VIEGYTVNGVERGSHRLKFSGNGEVRLIVTHLSQFAACDEVAGKAISAEGKSAIDFAAFTALGIFVDVEWRGV
jgi:hypothetical protein